MISEQEVESRVQERTGVEDGRQAANAVHAVLEVLGERLSHLEAEALSDDLPPALGASLRSDRHGETFPLAEFHQRVARRLGIRVGVAVELVSGVLETLGEALRGEVIDRLRIELQDDALASLFLTPERSEAPVHLHPERRTLAEGRAGGARPLYEARADRVQTESVAASENPHGETKLSSAHGLTQERERETLAEGRPGSSHPIGDLDH